MADSVKAVVQQMRKILLELAVTSRTRMCLFGVHLETIKLV